MDRSTVHIRDNVLCTIEEVDSLFTDDVLVLVLQNVVLKNDAVCIALMDKIEQSYQLRSLVLRSVDTSQCRDGLYRPIDLSRCRRLYSVEVYDTDLKYTPKMSRLG